MAHCSCYRIEVPIHILREGSWISCKKEFQVEVQESEWRLTKAKGPSMGKESGWDSGRAAVAAVVGGVVAVGTVPVALSAMGFTSVGIAASSIAAKMMSTAAIANGGGVAAGSLVAILQSVGAAELSVTSKVILGFAGTALGAWLGSPPSS
ncbi:interferon alpha-inducible protein 27-like protein 1 isoform X1 [Gorilla gorilla gorilla]|uniref:interferon alpha-inducible protein 27-like protein 1 isoform X1 n=2 Tax=Gorilla gorilla gorilla TaxID=9595 RepID=UPI0030092AD0